MGPIDESEREQIRNDIFNHPAHDGLKAGDTVRPKSGGPPLVIDRVVVVHSVGDVVYACRKADDYHANPTWDLYGGKDLELVPQDPLLSDIRRQMEAIMAGVPPVPVPNPNQKLAEAALKDLPLGYIATAEPIVIGIGDVVQLKSGGPRMVVVGIYAEGENVECCWFKADSSLGSDTFGAAMIMTAPIPNLGPVQPCTKWRDETTPVPKAASYAGSTPTPPLTGNPGGDAVG